MINFPVQIIFSIAQRESGEERILVEQEVGHCRFAEHINLRQALKLVSALEQKKQLCWQRIARDIIVESSEEWVFVGFLEQEFAIQLTRDAPRQTRFAYAYRAFHHDVAIFFQFHLFFSRSTCCPSQVASNSAIAPSPGMRKSGAISNSGCNTNAR